MQGPRAQYPRTIDNGAGSTLTFVRRAQEPDGRGEVLEVENVVQPGAGPPMHAHRFQEEGLTVRRGRLAYQKLGGVPRFVEAGESVVFLPGEPHRFWNAGDEVLECTGYVRPPDNVEYFLTALYDSQRRNGGRPDPLEAAFLLRRYGSEFAMPGIPAVAQRVVFPLLVLLGRALGRHRRYADAPEPRLR